MLLARDSREEGDPFEEMADIGIRPHLCTACIKFGGVKGLFEPYEQMLENTLMELVKDVRDDREKDVGIGKTFPKEVRYRLHSCLVACLCELDGGCVSQSDDAKGGCHITEGEVFVFFSDLVGRNVGCDRLATLDTRYENLFRIISRKRGIDWMGSKGPAITWVHR